MLRVKQGDAAAFTELVEKYKQPIMNLVYRTIHDPTEAEDLAQNVFVKVFKSASRYKNTAKFSTWLFTIARNLCLNEIRRRSRHPAESLDTPHPEQEDQPLRQFEDKKTFSPPDSTKSPIETSSRRRPAITRSSMPSKRPQRTTTPGPHASSRTRSWVSRMPRGDITTRGRSSVGPAAQ